MTITLSITVADQPGSGGGGPVDPPPTGGSGESVTTTATWQGITWTLSEACTVGYLASGMPYFVDPGHAVTVTWSPGTTTIGGLVAGGAMKNPDRSLYHGFDERVGSGYYQSASRQAAPASMQSNDSLVVQVPNTAPTTTAGGTSLHPVYSLGASALLCLAASPAANSFIPATGPYASGGTARPVYTLDTSALTLPSYSVPAGVESMATVLARMARYNPFAAQVRAVEERRKLTPGGFTNADGYGREVAIVMAQAGCRLIGNDATADKRTLAKYLMMHFAEWFPAIRANASKLTADGGQNEGLLMPIALGLGWTANADIANLHTLVETNELTQAFRVDATWLARIRSPHNNVANDWPQTTLRRTVSAVSGNTITFTDGASWQNVFIGTHLVRESDGATARVTAYSAAAKTMTIDAQPSPAFAVSDVCFNRAPYAQAEGDAEWTLKGLAQAKYYSPAAVAAYRDLNEWDGQLLALHALGFVHSNWLHFRDYVVRANAGTNPAAPDTYPDHFSSSGVRDFWNSHWATINDVSQTVG